MCLLVFFSRKHLRWIVLKERLPTSTVQPSSSDHHHHQQQHHHHQHHDAGVEMQVMQLVELTCIDTGVWPGVQAQV